MTLKYQLSTLLLLACVLGLSDAINDRPVIALLTIPSRTTGHAPGNYSYFPASYAKFIESAGARVVPLPYDAPPENLTFILNQVNGVFFIGGGAKIRLLDPDTGLYGPSNLTKAVAHIVEHVIEANKNGTHFPLMATCLGYEMLLLVLSNDYKILYQKFNDLSVRANVEFYLDGKNSRFWNHLPPALQNYSVMNPAFSYHHIQGILPYKFVSNKNLNKTMKITTISYPVNGGPPFVSSAEGREYPIFAMQFHPEKAAYEWLKETNAPHTKESIDIARRMINFFVQEARKNDRKFNSEEILQKSLAQNWPVQQKSSGFMQVYLFRTVLQEPESWPALFDLEAGNVKLKTKVGSRIKLKPKEDEPPKELSQEPYDMAYFAKVNSDQEL